MRIIQRKIVNKKKVKMKVMCNNVIDLILIRIKAKKVVKEVKKIIEEP